MKKIVFLILIVLFSFALASCSTNREISALGLLSGEQFILPFNGQVSSGGDYPQGESFPSKYTRSTAIELAKLGSHGMFFKSKSLEIKDFSKQISDDAISYFAQNLRGGFIVKENASGTYDYFFVAWLSDGYALTDMSCRLVSEDKGHGQLFLVPIHMVLDERLITCPSPWLFEGLEYETLYGIEEFEQFYEQSGWYNTKTEEGALYILSYRTEPTRSYTNSKDSLEGSFPIKIEFTEHAGQLFFKITHEQL